MSAPAPMPSAWIERFASHLPTSGAVLDVACGGGRHTRMFLGLGYRVIAIDRDLSLLADLAGDPDCELIEIDLETGAGFPLRGTTFAGVVVTNYLHRPILDDLVACVAVGGLLLYETFAVGNERFGRPTNPAYLLQPGELLDVVHGKLRVVAYEDIVVEEPRPAAVQRIAARREDRG